MATELIAARAGKERELAWNKEILEELKKKLSAFS
jgi:hypothetical protein